MTAISTIAQNPKTTSTSPRRWKSPAWRGTRCARRSKRLAAKVCSTAIAKIAAATISNGVACMQNTGLADNAVNAAFGWIGYGSPYLALALVYLATAVMTELMSNNAAAVLIVPVGMSVADHLGLDAKPFMVAITFAASTSFATPVGYQTNTMVYNAGNYRFADFIRIGLPLNIIFWVVASFAIPRFFPFSGA